MQKKLLEKLEVLPRLGEFPVEDKKCKICGSNAPIFGAVDFNKFCSSYPQQYGLADIAVPYYSCQLCDFLFTDFTDDWTSEEFSRFIYNDDYIKVDPEYSGARPVRAAKLMSEILKGCENLRILDYGSGSGIFSQEMKSRGFQFVENYDPFSSPVKPQGPFDFVLLFEVIEHVPNPMETFFSIREYLSDTGVIVVGQTLQPANMPDIQCNWWYVAPRNGHISTYSKKTFLIIADILGLTYYHGNGGLYGFAKSALIEQVQIAVKKFGAVNNLARLRSSNSNADGRWHESETMKNCSFRWTSSAEIVWSISSIPQSRTTIEIPFLLEIEPDFAVRSKIALDGQILTTTVKHNLPHGGAITAEFTSTDGGSHRVQLVTPNPITPMSQGRSNDERRLGLAIAE